MQLKAQQNTNCRNLLNSTKPGMLGNLITKQQQDLTELTLCLLVVVVVVLTVLYGVLCQKLNRGKHKHLNVDLH